MGRTILSRGEPFPNVRLKKTFRLHTDYDASEPQGGVDKGQYIHQRFPWLTSTRTFSGEREAGKKYLEQQTESGYRDVVVTDAGYDGQLFINKEDSHILTDEQWDEIRAMFPDKNWPDLNYNTPNNTRRIDAIRKPAELDDIVLNNLNGYRIVASDPDAGTITVTGQNWYASRKSTVQLNGTSKFAYDAYMGISAFLRDGLTSDPEVLYDRNIQYDYALCEILGQKLKISKIDEFIDDQIYTGRDLCLIMGGFSQGDTLSIDIRQINYDSKYSDRVSTSVTLTGDSGDTEIESFSGSIGNSTIGQPPPLRDGSAELTAPTRLRVKAVSRSVVGIWLEKADNTSAYELVINGTVRAHITTRDFYSDNRGDRYVPISLHTLHFEGEGLYFAPQIYDPSITVSYGSVKLFRRPAWITTMVATTGTFHQKNGVWRLRCRLSLHKLNFCSTFLWGGYSQVNGSGYEGRWKEDEYDLFEWPGCIDVFHNLHKPTGGMYNWAEINGETPVVEHPEWDAGNTLNNQVIIRDGHEHFVDPSIEIDIVYAIWPENNEARKPGNRMETYIRTADGEYRFTCGGVTSSVARETGLQKLTSFLCNPVDGAFVAAMSEIFAKNHVIEDDGDIIGFEIMDYECYQFVGEEAGGATLPTDIQGIYPFPMKPTPCEFPQASGIGTVTDGEYDLFGVNTPRGNWTKIAPFTTGADVADPDPDPDDGTVVEPDSDPDPKPDPEPTPVVIVPDPDPAPDPDPDPDSEPDPDPETTDPNPVDTGDTTTEEDPVDTTELNLTKQSAGSRISLPGISSEVILPKGAINKPATQSKNQAVLSRPDGSKIYIRSGRLES